MKTRMTILLALVLLLPSLSWAGTSSSTSAAGNFGARPYKQTFTSSGTFTPVTDIIYITGCGAGGGGAGGHTADPGGGGGSGAAGQCVVRMPIYLTGLGALTITIGTAGVSGAAGAVGGTTDLDTTIAGLPIGTYTLLGGHLQNGVVLSAATNVPGFGTATNGGVGGGSGGVSGGATATGNGNSCPFYSQRSAGGDVAVGAAGASGGGTGFGGLCAFSSGYGGADSMAGGAASGTMGGGGHGANSPFAIGGAGGSNSVGGNCLAGYGAGGGGGSGGNKAGGNGCPGFLRIEWWN